MNEPRIGAFFLWEQSGRPKIPVKILNQVGSYDVDAAAVYPIWLCANLLTHRAVRVYHCDLTRELTEMEVIAWASQE